MQVWIATSRASAIQMFAQSLTVPACLLQAELLDRLQELSEDAQLPQQVRVTLQELRSNFLGAPQLSLPKDQRLTDADRCVATPDLKKVLPLKLHPVPCKHASTSQHVMSHSNDKSSRVQSVHLTPLDLSLCWHCCCQICMAARWSRWPFKDCSTQGQLTTVCITDASYLMHYILTSTQCVTASQSHQGHVAMSVYSLAQTHPQ